MSALSVTQMRLERLADERARTEEKLGDLINLAEEEQRPLADFEEEQSTKYRQQLEEYDAEIAVLASDVERVNNSIDVSKVIRVNEREQEENVNGGPVVYRTFAAFARDELLTRYETLAKLAADGPENVIRVREEAKDRLQRAVEHTLTSDVQGLVPPQHMAQIMDLINTSRPVVASARNVDLTRGKLTYPKITGRPEVAKQGTEKTEGGTTKMEVELDDITADTYIGGGNLSWQTINWSTPDALQLWFDLAAESYAMQTETAACDELAGTAVGTISSPLGTTGTEDFAAWRAAILSGVAGIYSATGGRARTDTLYVAASRFFALAGLGTNQTLQLSTVGNLDIATLNGTYAGLRVVGSYGFTDANTAILGDASAFLVGETPGAPVQLRAVEPAIGGMEVGLIGAFKSKVFDTTRFVHLS